MSKIDKAIIAVWKELKSQKVDLNKIRVADFVKAVNALVNHPEFKG